MKGGAGGAAFACAAVLLVACAELPAVRIVAEQDDRPRPADLVYARLDGPGLGERVTIDSVRRHTALVVDADAEPDDLYPLGCSLRAADGRELWRRTVREPLLIRELLALVPSPIDLTRFLPELGEFVVPVPRAPPGARLRFERRELDGRRTPLGEVALDAVPERATTPPFVGATVTTIHGDALAAADALDVAILADGYTAADLTRFHAHAEAVAAEFLAEPAYAAFAHRVRVHRIDLVSAERGASFDCSGTAAATDAAPTCADRVRDTALGSIFPLRLATRLGVPLSDRAVVQRSPWRVADAAAMAPYDAVVVLVDTPKRAGFGLYHASVSAEQHDMARVVVHELGHAFGKLGDEYVAPSDLCQDVTLTPDFPNISPRVDARDIPWRAWLTPGIPLPTPRDPAWDAGVGLFAGAGAGCRDHFRPSANCLMHHHDAPMCAVCREQTVKRLYETFDVLAGVHLARGTLHLDLAAPEPIDGEWHLDGVRVASAAAPDGAPAAFALARLAPAGRHRVTLFVRPRTDLVRTGAERMTERIDLTVDVGP